MLGIDGQLRTFYVLFFIELKSRKVVIGGMTERPHQEWMKQIARDLTGWGGELESARYLIHDRDTKYSAAFRQVMAGAGCTCLKLPPRSPNLNAFAERFVRSIKDECLSQLILLTEKQVRYAIKEYMLHYHAERNHQGRGHELLCPDDRNGGTGTIQRDQRLGGLLSFYYREAG